MAPTMEEGSLALALTGRTRHEARRARRVTRPPRAGTHLLDFDGDLYGQPLATDLLVCLRPDARFASLEDLIAQLQIDQAQAREVLSRVIGAFRGLRSFTRHPPITL